MPPLAPERREFEFSATDEPHATRRSALLKTPAAPSIRALLAAGDATFAARGCAAVAAQLVMCWLVSDMAWPAVFALAYLVGGTVNHAMTLAMHETSHNLAFGHARPLANRLFGLLINAPLGIPAFASFQRYHKDHHTHQGERVLDTDVPTAREGEIFQSAPAKVAWVLMQPLFYALRPLLTAPKQPGAWETINLAAQVAFDAAIVAAFGWKALAYLIGGTLLGMGLHPMAGHFIAEHYTFIRGQEVGGGRGGGGAARARTAANVLLSPPSQTYSYYGPLNWLSFNVGYHNEHHDFPMMSGSQLPALRALAPAHYETLPHHSSWVLVIAQYIADPRVGPWSRVVRKQSQEAGNA